MYWFCGVNDNSKMHKDLYLIALKSAIQNTTLKPILLYDGTDEKFCVEVEKNATLVKHRTLFHNKINFQKQTQDWKSIASGAFLRIDIPIICKNLGIQDNKVLYTDTDVIFLTDVDELNTYNPSYFSICPEYDKQNYEIFNSGVMLINVQGMLNSYTEFVNFMEKNNYNFTAFDQGALQTFYKNKTDKLPLKFNHKPYWGMLDTAKIVHYHGPKYNNIKDYFNGKIIPEYKNLYETVNKDIWKYYLQLYESYSIGFDWKYYLDTYPDLRQNGVLTQKDAIIHWNNHGKKEGRKINLSTF